MSHGGPQLTKYFFPNLFMLGHNFETFCCLS